jgi:hypothetical protein
MSNNLLSLFNQDLHISDVYREVFKKLGLEFRGTYTIRQLIERSKERNFDILRIKGVDFLKDVDFLIDDITNTGFRTKFFGAVMFEDEESRQSYEKTIEMLNESFVLDEMELKSSSGSEDAFLYIRGLSSGTELKMNIPRLEILVIKVPY